MQNKSPQLFRLRAAKVVQASYQELLTTQGFQKLSRRKKPHEGILFIHGFTVSPANFFVYGKALEKAGFCVTCPLLPGHGEAPSKLLNTQKEEWQKTVDEAYEKMSKHCENVTVIAISMGCTLALNLAAKYPVKKLILLSPAVYPNFLLNFGIKTFIPLMQKFGYKYWPHIAGDVKKKNAYELGYKKVPLHALQEVFNLMKETQKILSKVTAPTVIFQSKTDHEVPSRKAAVILKKLSSTSKKIHWLKNSYHEIPRDYEGKFVLQKIMEELAYTGS